MDSARPGSGPATARKTARTVTITTVLPIGAAAVTAKRRRAYNSAVATVAKP